MFTFSGLLALSFAFAQQSTQVKSFSPQGYAKSVEQVRIEFSQPMVRFGDIRLDYPAQSDCFKKGQGRWVDTRNWVFDFDEALPGGILCIVKAMGQTFQFHTGGAHIKEVFPRQYRPIDPQQAFVLMLDADVKQDSVSEGAYFLIEGLGDRIPVSVVTGGDAKKLRSAAELEYKYEAESFVGQELILKAQRAFPPGARVSLVWSKKIQSLSGHTSPQDEILEFTVAEPFKAEFSCDREAPGKPCIPLLPMRLTFSSSISATEARKIYLEDATGKRLLAEENQDEGDKARTSYLVFKGPFTQNAVYKLNIPRGIKDEEGRELSNQSQYPLVIKTGEDPSLLKFPSAFGLIEAGPESAIAVTLRRVEQVLTTKFAGVTGKFDSKNFKNILGMLNEVQRSPHDSKRLSFSKSVDVKKIQVQKPLKASDLEVVGIPLKNPGFYMVEMESPLLGQALLNTKSPYFVRSAALVTNMAVHLKHSTKEAWVWVTELKSARVVAGASVKIFDVLGNEVASGVTDSRGLAYFSFKKSTDEWPRNQQAYYYDGFFAVVEKGADFSFTHSSWNSGIESWRYQLGMSDYGPSLVGHAILDRTLFKPEESVSAKLILRKAQGKGLVLPAANEWPTHLEVTHNSGLQSFKVPLEWDKNRGTALFQWKMPIGTKMGGWRLTLLKDKPAIAVEVGDFAVESFRVPLVQMRLNAAKPAFVNEKNIPIQVTGQYLAGGPSANLPLKLRWSVEPSSFYAQDENLLDYSFANGAVKEGLFRSGEEEGVRYIPQSGSQDLKLNSQGAAQLGLNNLKYANGPQRLRTEVEFKDPNGEIQSAIRSFMLWPSSVIVGIKSKAWWATPDKVEFDIAALDLMQNPVKGQKVQVDLYTSRYYSHRKRLVGGFYSYEDFREYRKVGELCKGETNTQGIFNCSGRSKVTGSVLAVVSTRDPEGRVSYANVNQWVVKPGENQWFGSGDNDRVDLIPFKKSYEPGETAEFQLRTPFPEARVLVTVERDTVLHSEVVEIKADNPVIRLPIKKEYAPNVVVSAFAIRGRLQDPKPTALVDLAKPSFKLGMTNVRVGWKENALKVAVSTDQKKYKARQKSQVTVSVTTANGQPAAQGEVALVAVDEGLLELRENDTWDLLKAMMIQRPHKIETATAQSWLVGRRHFGLKALPIGGDGGGGLRRELFDTLLYWNPRVRLDARGQAKMDIPLNDSTTSFRIVAIAQQGVDQFGTGWTSIQSSQDIMILPGLAGVARVGDEFQAGFTVRNASTESQVLNVSLKTSPEVPGLATQRLQLAPGQAQELHWNIKVGDGEKLDYIVTAKNTAGQRLDEIKKSQKILPVRVSRIQQSEWGQWPEFKALDLKQPEGAFNSQGSVIVELNERLGDSATGLQEFWKNYSYTCLEQEVSRVVSLQDKKNWNRLEAKLAASMDANGLLRYFPSSGAKGSVSLTAYVLSIAHEAGFSISEENQNRMLEALNLFAQGRLKEEVNFSRADEALRKITAFEALSRYRRLNLDLLSSVEYSPAQWPLYTLVEWFQILQWEKNAPQRDVRLGEIEKIMRNRFYFSAKRMQLRDENLESMPWLMRDSDSASLRLILATMNLANWKEDLPRLYQGVLARQSQGAWMLTANNAWGRLVMKKMETVFPTEKAQGEFQLNLSGARQAHAWSKGGQAVLEVPWKNKDARVEWKQQGEGKPWISVSAKVAVPVTKPTFAGFTMEKTVTPVEQKKKGVWSVGDIAKIQIKVKPKAPQTWVVVEDPLPAGSSVLQSSWGTAVERREDLIRFYFSWFAGDENIEYTVRFNQAGTYQLPVSRVEAMYSPDLFAELPEGEWRVSE